MMDSLDWEAVIFGFGFMTLFTIVFVVILMQVGAFSRARIARKQEERFRTLGEQYESLAVRATDQQEKAAAELTGIRERLDAVERVLREVD